MKKLILTNSLFLLNDLRNFTGIFRKDVTYDNIKSHKNQGFTFSLEDTFLEKPQGGQNDPPAFVGLNCITLIALQPQPWWILA